MNSFLDLTATLIVDDEESIRKILSHQLISVGCVCTEARNGLEALALLNQNHYDLVFMDIEMPKLNGLNVIREIRHSLLISQPYIIVISGSPDPYLREKSYRMGADYFLAKPYTPSQLENALELFRTMQMTPAGLNNEIDYYAGGGT